MYAIIDIETTGRGFDYGKITEVAIYVHDGKKVIDEFVSLVNPEQYIPQNITQLTGITNQMVSDAPKFYELAKRIVEITEGNIFVAHNVAFDYGFIKAEFSALGFDFERETLCTVKLSRKFFPDFKSYSLGNICTNLGISNDARHRAAGDALATVTLFEKLLEKSNGIILPYDGNKFFSAESLHPSLDVNEIKSILKDVGVYYLYNEKDDLIYIGKSINIQQRVLNHIGQVKTQKAIKMKAEIAAVKYELTGSELIALLKESAEIKLNKPKYNKAQRKSRYSYGLFSFVDRKGYKRLNVAKNEGSLTPLVSFESLKEGKDYLFSYCEKYNLCQKLCGLSDASGSCFQYQIRICKGACLGEEEADFYNKKVDEFIKKLSFEKQDFIIVDKGRKESEKSVVLIQGGKYIGYGWVEKEWDYSSFNALKKDFVFNEDNRDARLIIKRQLTEREDLEVVEATFIV